MKDERLVLGREAVIEAAVAPESHIKMTVGASHNGTRIDKFLPQRIRGYSRNFFQHLIKVGLIKINDNKDLKDSTHVKEDDVVEVTFPPSRPRRKPIRTNELGIKVVHDHQHFLIIDKPSGLLTHPPSPMSESVAVSDWIEDNFEEISGVGYAERPGIVHRLDRETSGLLVVPRTNYAFKHFSKMFKSRTINKTCFLSFEFLEINNAQY